MTRDVVELAIQKKADLMAEIEAIMSRVEELEDFIELGKSLRDGDVVPKSEPLQLKQPSQG